jgi:hypothetical protein
MRAYSAFASFVLPAAARVAACTAREEVVRTEPGTWISLIYYREGLLGAVLSWAMGKAGWFLRALELPWLIFRYGEQK